MKRLSHYMKPTTKRQPKWWSVLGEMLEYYFEDSPFTNQLMEGISPERIVLHGKWFKEPWRATVSIKPSKHHTAYPFYPPEYIMGEKTWSSSTTIFAVFAIFYKYITGEYPFLGQIPQGVFTSDDALKTYVMENRNRPLDLTRIPHPFRYIFNKCLNLNEKFRYHGLTDFEEAYGIALNDEFCNKDWFTEPKNQNPFPGTVRLGDILDQIDGSSYSDLGFILFGKICIAVQKRTLNLNTLIGICPQHIYLNADWAKSGIKEIHITEDKFPHVFYAYYSPQFSKTGQWDSSDTVFALACIMYRIYTCILPYIDDPDEDIDALLSTPHVENISGERKYPLYLDCIPEPLRPFFQKALELKKKDRYPSLKAAADDFFRLPFAGTLYIKSDDTPLFELELMQQEYLNRPK